MSSKFTLVLDSSQIQTFLECPTRWQNQYVKRLVPQVFDLAGAQQAMNAGTYGHKLLDIYYRARARRESLDNAMSEAFAYDADKDQCECGCSHFHHKRIEALNIDECARCKKCLSYRPKPFPLDPETRLQVRNRFRDYCIKWMSNDIIPRSEEHVEIGFSERLFEDSDNLFVLEGRIDLLGSLQGLNVLVDHKFQVSTHWLYSNSVQFKNYAMVSHVPTLVINYVRLVKAIKPDSLYRDVINFSAPQLASWKHKLIGVFFDIKASIESNSYKQQWNACQGTYKTYDKNTPNWCWFGALCEESNEQMRERKEKQLYAIQKNVWRPW
jgi:PD-(D/E)XK nuclease superfamily protein